MEVREGLSEKVTMVKVVVNYALKCILPFTSMWVELFASRCGQETGSCRWGGSRSDERHF